MTMIEKMARALCAERVRTTSEEWKRYRYDDSWKLFVNDARIALAALMEPTPKMTEAGDDVEMYGVSVLGIGESHSVFCTMIQAALDEK